MQHFRNSLLFLIICYKIKGNKLKFYICSYNVYALGFCCSIPSVNGIFFFFIGDAKHNLFWELNLIIEFYFEKWDKIIELNSLCTLFFEVTQWRELSTCKLYLLIYTKSCLLNLVLFLIINTFVFII